MEVERLISTLLYEAEDSKPLALAQIDDVHFNLDVHPDTLKLTTALGNVKAQDGQLPEVQSCFYLPCICVVKVAKTLRPVCLAAHI